MNRPLIYAALALVLVLGAVTIYEFTKPISFYGSRIDPPKPMAGFTLQSVDGPRSLDDFRGKPVILYFGYTSCPDICPTTLAQLKLALEKIGEEKARQMQVIFVSVDYRRDTPEKVDGYVKNFRPDFLGLTGSQAEIDQATREFGIYYQLADPDPETGSYLVDHTTRLLFLDASGALVMTWPYETQVNELASDLENLLKE